MEETLRERDTRRRKRKEKFKLVEPREELKASDEKSDQKAIGIVQLNNQKDLINKHDIMDDRSLSKMRAQKKFNATEDPLP